MCPNSQNDPTMISIGINGLGNTFVSWSRQVRLVPLHYGLGGVDRRSQGSAIGTLACYTSKLPADCRLYESGRICSKEDFLEE